MQYKKDFPIFKTHKNLVYLDSSATSQKPQAVIDSVNNFYTTYNSNIHRGLYNLSQKAEDLYEQTRIKIAKFINAKNINEIIFTGNATESINLAAFGYFEKYLKKEDIIILSEMEHHSNIVPWLMLKEKLGIKIIYIPLTDNFELDYKKILNSKINFKKVKLISLTHGSNVLGTINPLEIIIANFKNKCGPDLKILIDAAQTIAHTKIDVVKLKCDFLVFSSHKMFGPSGVGVLYINQKYLEKTNPIIYGGHMIETVTKEKATFAPSPQKFEAGTGKLEEVIGLGTAIDYINSVSIKNIQKHEESLTIKLITKLSKIKNIKMYGKKENKNRLPVFSFNIGNIHPHDVSEILNRQSICVRAGHHCTQVLMDSLNTKSGTVRASFSIYNTPEDIDKLVLGIENVKKIFKID